MKGGVGEEDEEDVKNFALDANPSHESIASEEDHSLWDGHDTSSPPSSPELAPARPRFSPFSPSPSSLPSEIVMLNVGGHRFSTSSTTLLKDGSSMLAAMFSGRFAPARDHTGAVFIDRDGTHFRHILNYLRDGIVYLPEDDMQMRQELLAEAQYAPSTSFPLHPSALLPFSTPSTSFPFRLVSLPLLVPLLLCGRAMYHVVDRVVDGIDSPHTLAGTTSCTG